MNIYDLLRFFVKSLSSLGPVSKEDAFNAIDLVNQLEKVNAFGEIGRITTGSHQFKAKQKRIHNATLYDINECGICGKGQAEHE